ncbi:MAG: porin family protein [Desulfobulbaceae bacterium]|jgi:opacity protein-like surface antigen|nr:porin family protein [Desulfobulbaceae bacterium]
MKKKMLIIAGCTMLLSLSNSAYSAEETPYISGNLGFGMLTDSDTDNVELDVRNGYALTAAYGYKLNDNLRLEGELAYQNNELVTGRDDIESLALLANGYWDFTNDSSWTPFLTAGIGAATVNVDDPGLDDSETVFAYQIGAGIGYAINEELTVDCKYRYFATADPELAGVDVEYATHNIYAGMRYTF